MLEEAKTQTSVPTGKGTDFIWLNPDQELVAQAYEQRVDWFVLREGVYESLQSDAEGILRSEVFPGL